MIPPLLSVALQKSINRAGHLIRGWKDSLTGVDMLTELDGLEYGAVERHAVKPGSEGMRLSLSCCVGYRGPAMPLSFWS